MRRVLFQLKKMFKVVVFRAAGKLQIAGKDTVVMYQVDMIETK